MLDAIMMFLYLACLALCSCSSDRFRWLNIGGNNVINSEYKALSNLNDPYRATADGFAGKGDLTLASPGPSQRFTELKFREPLNIDLYRPRDGTNDSDVAFYDNISAASVYVNAQATDTSGVAAQKGKALKDLLTFIKSGKTFARVKLEALFALSKLHITHQLSVLDSSCLYSDCEHRKEPGWGNLETCYQIMFYLVQFVHVHSLIDQELISALFQVLKSLDFNESNHAATLLARIYSHNIHSAFIKTSATSIIYSMSHDNKNWVPRGLDNLLDLALKCGRSFLDLKDKTIVQRYIAPLYDHPHLKFFKKSLSNLVKANMSIKGSLTGMPIMDKNVFEPILDAVCRCLNKRVLTHAHKKALLDSLEYLIPMAKHRNDCIQKLFAGLAKSFTCSGSTPKTFMTAAVMYVDAVGTLLKGRTQFDLNSLCIQVTYQDSHGVNITKRISPEEFINGLNCKVCESVCYKEKAKNAFVLKAEHAQRVLRSLSRTVKSSKSICEDLKGLVPIEQHTILAAKKLNAKWECELEVEASGLKLDSFGGGMKRTRPDDVEIFVWNPASLHDSSWIDESFPESDCAEASDIEERPLKKTRLD